MSPAASARPPAEAGAEIVFMDRSRFRDMDIRGERLKTLPVYPEIYRVRPGDQRAGRRNTTAFPASRCA